MTGLPGFTGESLPVSPGKLYGLRVFDVDIESGALTGVSYPEKWHGGENVATCQDTEKSSKEHSMKECYHGYWSYFGTKLDMLTVERAPVIIEGYGEVVVGEFGFRAEKARIKGIVVPDAKEVASRKIARTEENLRTIRKEQIHLMQGLIIMMAVSVGIAYLIVTKGGFPNLLVGFLTVIGALYSLLLVMATAASVWMFFDIRAHQKKKRAEVKKAEKLSQGDPSAQQEEFASLVQEKYPDAVLYPTLKDMLKTHQKDLIPHGSVLF